MDDKTKALLEEIEAGIDDTEMVETPSENLPDSARMLEGTTPKGWKLMVIEFSTEDFGQPPGSKGYDGTAVRAPHVIHLPYELADKAGKRAKA